MKTNKIYHVSSLNCDEKNTLEYSGPYEFRIEIPAVKNLLESVAVISCNYRFTFPTIDISNDILWWQYENPPGTVWAINVNIPHGTYSRTSFRALLETLFEASGGGLYHFTIADVSGNFVITETGGQLWRFRDDPGRFSYNHVMGYIQLPQSYSDVQYIYGVSLLRTNCVYVSVESDLTRNLELSEVPKKSIRHLFSIPITSSSSDPVAMVNMNVNHTILGSKQPSSNMYLHVKLYDHTGEDLMVVLKKDNQLVLSDYLEFELLLVLKSPS